MKKPLWETHSIGEVIYALQNWGNGSGEEVSDYLETHGMTPVTAKHVHTLLMMLRTEEPSQ